MGVGQDDYYDYDNMSVLEAREWIYERIEQKGVKCPCCYRFNKVYTRHLRGSMIFTLGVLYDADRRTPGEYINVVRYSVGRYGHAPNADFVKMRWWGFIEVERNEDGTPVGGGGRYRIKDKGKAFIDGRIRVPSSVDEYQNRVVRWGTRLVSVNDILYEPFDREKITKPTKPAEG